MIERRTAIATTAMGLFHGFSEAQRVIHTCVARGVPYEAITIIANREETSVGDALAAAALGVPVDVGPASRGQLAALMALGVLAEEAEPYAEGLRRGGTLVSVTAAAPQVDAVVELMERYATADLNED